MPMLAASRRGIRQSRPTVFLDTFGRPAGADITAVRWRGNRPPGVAGYTYVQGDLTIKADGRCGPDATNIGLGIIETGFQPRSLIPSFDTGNNGNAGLVVCAIDTLNFMRIDLNQASMSVYKCIAGVYTQVVGPDYGFRYLTNTAGQNYTVDFTGTDLHVMGYGVTVPVALRAATKVGLFCDTDVRFTKLQVSGV